MSLHSTSSQNIKMMALGTNKRFYAAEVKNRAEQVKLEAKLAKIEKEQQRDEKLFNIERQKFKQKYPRFTNEESEDSPYETFTPGLRYSKSEQQNSLPSPESAPSQHFELIHSMIFTNGEVDLEKILILHLLCTHRTETLTPSKKKVSNLCRDHSRTERLIDRSKRGFTHYERLSKLLPLYIIEIIDNGPMGEKPSILINDGRLASRILINEKVMALVNTVATTLEKVNMKKFKQLLVMGNTPAQMRDILQSEHIAEFLDSLLDHKLINSCESFVLTPPFKIRVHDLRVKTSHGNLENLITQLRQNVLQEPSREVAAELKEEEVEMATESLKGSVTSTTSPRAETKRPNVSSGSKTSSSRPTKVLAGSSKVSAKVDLKKEATKRSLGEEDRPIRYKSINFIARNRAAAAKTKKIEYDFEEDEGFDYDIHKRSSTSSGSSGRPKMKIMEPVIPTKTVVNLPVVEEKESEPEKTINAVESNKTNENESEPSPEVEEKSKAKKSKLDARRREHSNHIRQSTCPACMERWKAPLPPPKIPRVKKSDVLPEYYSNDLKTNSHHRISMMINKAMYKLQSYDRRYSPENAGFRKVAPQKKDTEDEDLDNVYLTPMDLAKIEQEIKEKEAQKKLENFLDKYSNFRNNTSNNQ